MSLISVKKYFNKIKSRFSPLSCSALIAFVTLSMLFYVAASPLEGEEELYSNIIRFHVLANSDSKEDQALKLSVRDEVIKYTTNLLNNITDLDAAAQILESHKNEIAEIARKVVLNSGANYDISVQICKEVYPTRVYSNYTFPAGVYNSFKIKIGKAQGKNWWCVLFPPLCTAGAVREEYTSDKALTEIGFSEDEIKLITEKDATRTKIRFFALEIINKLKN